MAFDTVRTQQDALGADRARRRHRHHVDRRHDGADPRLRPVAARHDPRDRPEHDLRPAVRRHAASPTAPSSRELLKRPNLTLSDARALEEQSDDARARGHRARRRAGPPTQQRVFYRDQKTQAARRLRHVARTSPTARGSRSSPAGSSTAPRCSTARTSSCSATPVQAAVRADAASIRSARPCASAAERFEVVGVFDKRPAAGGFNLGQDDFVVIPYTAYQRVFGLRVASAANRSARS